MAAARISDASQTANWTPPVVWCVCPIQKPVLVLFVFYAIRQVREIARILCREEGNETKSIHHFTRYCFAEGSE